MFILFKRFTFILLLALSFLASQVIAKDVVIGMGRSVPPYIIQEQNSGLEYEIIEAALAAVGHQLIPVYFPLARIEQMLMKQKVDATTPLKKRDGQHLCYSDSHIQYQNVAIALKKHEFKIKSVQDLSGKRLIAFQKAAQYLGDQYARVVSQKPDYQEFPDQNKQVHALFSGDADVIIADKNIFSYFYQHSKRKQDFEEHIVFPIFPPSDYSVGFNDSTLCEDFNRGLGMIKLDKTYQKILGNYLAR